MSVCVGLSRANTANPQMITELVSEASGLSTKSLHASLAYIEQHKPAIWQLENVINKQAIELVAKLLRTRLTSSATLSKSS